MCARFLVYEYMENGSLKEHLQCMYVKFIHLYTKSIQKPPQKNKKLECVTLHP